MEVPKLFPESTYEAEFSKVLGYLKCVFTRDTEISTNYSNSQFYSTTKGNAPTIILDYKGLKEEIIKYNDAVEVGKKFNSGVIDGLTKMSEPNAVVLFADIQACIILLNYPI